MRFGDTKPSEKRLLFGADERADIDKLLVLAIGGSTSAAGEAPETI